MATSLHRRVAADRARAPIALTKPRLAGNPCNAARLVQRRLRQRPLVHRRQRLLEFGRRRHADQDRAHRLVGDREAHRRLRQAARVPLLHQRHQPPRTLQIGIVGVGRPDRIGRRAGDRMPLRHAAQRAAGQHANADDADAGGLRMVEHPAVVLRRIARRQRLGRTRVQHVVADLRGDEGARVDHLMQRRRIADRGDAGKPQLALLAQLLERRHHLVQHRLRRQRLTAAIRW